MQQHESQLSAEDPLLCNPCENDRLRNGDISHKIPVACVINDIYPHRCNLHLDAAMLIAEDAEAGPWHLVRLLSLRLLGQGV